MTGFVEEVRVVRHVPLDAAAVELDALEAKVERCLDIAGEAAIAAIGLQRAPGALLLAVAVVAVPPWDEAELLCPGCHCAHVGEEGLVNDRVAVCPVEALAAGS